MRAKSFFRRLGIILLAFTMILVDGWCLIAIWYQRGIIEPFRTALITALALLFCILVGVLATRRRWIALALYCLLLAFFFGWWATIVPRNDLNWAPDVAR